MTSEQIKKYVLQLHSTMPVLGGMQRESGRKALSSLKEQSEIDVACQMWAESRDPVTGGRSDALGSIISSCAYVAVQPVRVRVLSALKANKLDAAVENAFAIPTLLASLADSDKTMAQRANEALRSLKNAEAIDALCEHAMLEPSSSAASIVKEKNYQPHSVSRRCVFFLLTGQLDRYFELDFELQHLSAEYEAADETFRRLIDEVVRSSADSRLVELYRKTRRRTAQGPIKKRGSELTDSEADIAIHVYARNKQWNEIFRLLFQIPLSSAVKALDALAQSGWKPENPVEADLLDELKHSRSWIGEIPEKPVSPSVSLGPVLYGWIDRGRALEFTAKTDEELRQVFHDAPPPQAVSALSSLVSGNKITPEDVDAARSHKHWLVRLACLALCETSPHFAFSEKPRTDGGGGLWIEMLAPSVLEAFAYQRRAIAITPDQLQSLQNFMEKEVWSFKTRAAWARLLEALARHYLRHTIEVDDRMMVEISETDIEAEG